MAKRNAKNIVLPHSQAKLDLFKSYLEKYLPILTLAKGITKINIYDIFCGSGVYEDGNIGSPLIAVECVRKTNQLMDKNNWTKKPITLSINDGEKGKIDNVKNLFNDVKIDNLSLSFFNLDADDMLDKVISDINSFSTKERNLMFIDPYGYSHIDKGRILRLLKNARTEIVLFLPVMHMYRFSEIAILDQERKCL
jgi:three-Cys-motif partner protein